MVPSGHGRAAVRAAILGVLPSLEETHCRPPRPVTPAAARHRASIAIAVRRCACSSRCRAASPACRGPRSARTRRPRRRRRPPRRPDRPDGPRRDRHVLRPRLRSRRRDVAVRRARPCARRPGRGDDPGPLLPGRDARDDRDDPADPRPRPVDAGPRRRQPPLRIYGRRDRRGRSTASWRRSRPTPRFAVIPHDDRRRPAPADDLAAAGRGPERRDPPRRPASPRASSSAARRRTSRLQLWLEAGTTYDQYRGILRVFTASTDAYRERRRRPAARALPARRRAGRDAVELAGRGAAGPGRSRPLVRGPPAPPGRLVLTTSRTTRARRSTAASRPSGRRPNAAIAATAGRRPLERHRRSPTRCSTRPAAARPRTTRTSSRRATGAKVAGAVTLPARLAGPRRRRHARTTPARRTRPGRRRRTRGPAVGLVRRRPADGRRHADGPRPARPGCLGPAHQRHAHRLGGHEDGLRRGLPVGAQRRPAGRRPDAAQHALRHGADPLTPGIVAPRDRATTPLLVGRRATARSPDPLMVAYHDDEWGTPVHDDVELFERLVARVVPGRPLVVDDPAQARGVPGGVPRLRSAGRRRRSTTRDRARLMADAGIVRNRREDRRHDRQRRGATSRQPATFGSFDALPRHDRPAAAGAPAARHARIGRHPGDDPGLRRAVGRPAAARLPVRRLDDRLRVHAERRAASTTTSRAASATGAEARRLQSRAARTTRPRRRGRARSRRSTRRRSRAAAASSA